MIDIVYFWLGTYITLGSSIASLVYKRLNSQLFFFLWLKISYMLYNCTKGAI